MNSIESIKAATGATAAGTGEGAAGTAEGFAQLLAGVPLSTAAVGTAAVDSGADVAADGEAAEPAAAAVDPLRALLASLLRSPQAAAPAAAGASPAAPAASAGGAVPTDAPVAGIDAGRGRGVWTFPLPAANPAAPAPATGGATVAAAAGEGVPAARPAALEGDAADADALAPADVAGADTGVLTDGEVTDAAATPLDPLRTRLASLLWPQPVAAAAMLPLSAADLAAAPVAVDPAAVAGLPEAAPQPGMAPVEVATPAEVPVGGVDIGRGRGEWAFPLAAGSAAVPTRAESVAPPPAALGEGGAKDVLAARPAGAPTAETDAPAIASVAADPAAVASLPEAALQPGTAPTETPVTGVDAGRGRVVRSFPLPAGNAAAAALVAGAVAAAAVAGEGAAEGAPTARPAAAEGAEADAPADATTPALAPPVVASDAAAVASTPAPTAPATPAADAAAGLAAAGLAAALPPPAPAPASVRAGSARLPSPTVAPLLARTATPAPAATADAGTGTAPATASGTRGGDAAAPPSTPVAEAGAPLVVSAHGAGEADQASTGPSTSLLGAASAPPPADRPAPANAPPVQLPVEQPRSWAPALGEQLAWMVQNREQHAEIRVSPPHLGPVEVRLQLAQDTADVSFRAHDAGVREVLEASLPRLRELLGSQGVQLGQTSVSDHPASRQPAAGWSGADAQRQGDPHGGARERLPHDAPFSTGGDELTIPVRALLGGIDHYV